MKNSWLKTNPDKPILAERRKHCENEAVHRLTFICRALCLGRLKYDAAFWTWCIHLWYWALKQKQSPRTWLSCWANNPTFTSSVFSGQITVLTWQIHQENTLSSSTSEGKNTKQPKHRGHRVLMCSSGCSGLETLPLSSSPVTSESRPAGHAACPSGSPASSAPQWKGNDNPITPAADPLTWWG